MPMLVKELIGKGEPGTLEWSGQSLEFVYNPNAISYRERKRLRRLVLEQEEKPDEDLEKDWLIVYIRKMVVSWELYGTEADRKAKRPVPIEPEFLDSLPSPFLLALVGRIGELTSPPPTPVTGSDGSFSALAETNGVTAPTGI